MVMYLPWSRAGTDVKSKEWKFSSEIVFSWSFLRREYLNLFNHKSKFTYFITHLFRSSIVNVHFCSSKGNIHLCSLKGNIHLCSSKGNIHLCSTKRNIHIRSSKGNIHLFCSSKGNIFFPSLAPFTISFYSVCTLITNLPFHCISLCRCKYVLNTVQILLKEIIYI